VNCDTCGKTLEISDWPFCPHGRGLGMLGEFKPYYEPNLGHEPVLITSLAQKQRLLKAAGLEERESRLKNRDDAIDRLMARRDRVRDQMRD
jgi:hypothetical protein